ncbi:MAG: GerW family sporulation protein [Clostridia bacterium]|nr:GerW family sporulation protein [Clostridia bacterium]
MSENKINDFMSTAMSGIRDMIDVNTIVGNPVTTPDGTTIIPISKVCFGFASGGSDFGKQPEKQKFGGGSGAGVSITPVAFLSIKDGDVRVLSVDPDESGIDKAIQSVPTVIEKLSNMFKRKSKKGDKAKEAAEKAVEEAIEEAKEAE